MATAQVDTVPDLSDGGNNTTVGEYTTAASTTWEGGVDAVRDVPEVTKEVVWRQHPVSGSEMTTGQAIHLVLEDQGKPRGMPVYVLVASVALALVVGFFTGRMLKKT